MIELDVNCIPYKKWYDIKMIVMDMNSIEESRDFYFGLWHREHFVRTMWTWMEAISKYGATYLSKDPKKTLM